MNDAHGLLWTNVAWALSGFAAWLWAAFASEAFWGSAMGAMFGIPAGFALNHLWEQHSASIARKTHLYMLSVALHANRNILCGFIAETSKVGIGTFRLEISLLQAVPERKYDLLGDHELCRKIDSLRWKLESFDAALSYYLSMAFNPASFTQRATTPGSSNFYTDNAPMLMEYLVATAEKITENIDDILPKLPHDPFGAKQSIEEAIAATENTLTPEDQQSPSLSPPPGDPPAAS